LTSSEEQEEAGEEQEQAVASMHKHTHAVPLTPLPLATCQLSVVSLALAHFLGPLPL